MYPCTFHSHFLPMHSFLWTNSSQTHPRFILENRAINRGGGQIGWITKIWKRKTRTNLGKRGFSVVW